MRKRERDLQCEYYNSFTTITTNNNNTRIKAKYTKLILSFPELHATRASIPPVAARQASRSPGLDSEVEGKQIQEYTDWNLDEDHRQENEPGRLHKLAMDEESETLMIPQL